MTLKEQKVLLVEDVLSMSMLFTKHLEAAGIHAVAVEDLASARAAQAKESFDLLLLDLNLPDGDGLAYLEELRGTPMETPAIVITADASLNNAVRAMKLGALDYLVKPFSESRLVTTVNNTLERVQLRQQVEVLRHETQEGAFYDFIGNSVAMQKVYRTIENVAPSKATVFVTGASGTGKELCAEAIHKAGPRANKPFVPLNCAAIPQDLLESELFGHLKGSFTGAIADRLGAAREAEGGTLFLDEMCELDLGLQKKLLRFLQTSTVQPVGSAKPEKVDVRVICATNRDPLEEVRAGRFREDLYFRLNVVPIALPALKERGRDVIDIARSFLTRFAEEEGKNLCDFSAEAQALLMAHNWPGNVRELQNTIRNIAVLQEGDTVTPEMFPALEGQTDAVAPASAQPIEASGRLNSTGPVSPTDNNLMGTLAEIERKAIEDRIAVFDGSIPKAADSLGVSPSTIYRKKENWD
ncbi:MAG: sigma-54-dependent Fis family transcriptional regulator [Kordiimonadaceae bacterium]|nr:sigma-54-dependent Fis family transcriptional regulator [Kordiimonadaceae bacterium]MBO6570773.1 sigma-54-dependent Fis family transcriptional regulator [Kordiimonadaceae bacterium]MBO6965454.1 sigma-54-dependent Fis family transcriptional regulator [Kordiimonadaceae bacterium]